ncbi:hypothetical protein FRC18_005588 [Serendipita sp. 400]|nr:hypothetical protein FRC18_005588 [Serendipita sp. 400]
MDPNRIENDLAQLRARFPRGNPALLKQYYEESACDMKLTMDFLLADPSIVEDGTVSTPYMDGHAHGSAHFAGQPGGLHPEAFQYNALPASSGTVLYTVPQSQHETCLGCMNPAAPGELFCSQRCAANQLNRSPLVLLPPLHSVRAAVEKQFAAEWRHNQDVPDVHYIYAIVSSRVVNERYLAHRNTVERQRNCQSLGLKPGNEQLRWHGTRRRCKLGDKGETQTCDDEKCALCSIIRSSFDVNRFGKSWGRFGRGIYTSATSSKSNDYIRNRSANIFKLRFAPPLKPVLLSNVIVGASKHLERNADKLTAPPDGFDSVSGEPGQALNYDETVVYTNSAIRPAFLLMYA